MPGSRSTHTRRSSLSQSIRTNISPSTRTSTSKNTPRPALGACHRTFMPSRPGPTAPSSRRRSTSRLSSVESQALEKRRRASTLCGSWLRFAVRGGLTSLREKSWGPARSLSPLETPKRFATITLPALASLLSCTLTIKQPFAGPASILTSLRRTASFCRRRVSGAFMSSLSFWQPRSMATCPAHRRATHTYAVASAPRLSTRMTSLTSRRSRPRWENWGSAEESRPTFGMPCLHYSSSAMSSTRVLMVTPATRPS
mmetsp:Transcript_10810/g.32359  ORF Transcript_10810/g.32359 Transcript_10810/m.32359 type:complete len:256 (-) Transcript_10810:388-1155(-)